MADPPDGQGLTQWRDAKARLVAMKVPLPQADPKARARMVADQNAPRPRNSFAKKPLQVLHSGPTGEMRTAARVGEPNLEPEADTTSATDVLTGGNSSRIVVGGSGGGGGTTGGSGNATGIVATVTPGGTKTEAESAAPADANAPADASAPAGTTPENGAPTTAPQPESSSAIPGESTSAAPATASGDATVATGTDASGTTASGTANTTDASKTDAAPTAAGNQGDNIKESTSKKKKGVRKLVPW